MRGAAGLAVAGAIALASGAAAAPQPGAEPGAYCTRPGCGDAARPAASGVAGFALAALASVGLGRRARRRARCEA
jgi:hypothetical protein